MQAMVKVKDQRKLEAAERKAEKDQINALKRPAAASKGEPSHKRPAAKGAVKLEPAPPLKPEPSLKLRPAAATPTAAEGRPSCPPEAATDVTYYKCGKVYNSHKRKAFRAMRCATNYYTETSAAWKDDREAAWDKVLSAIERYHAENA